MSRVNRIRFRVKRGMEGTVPTEPKMVVNWKMDNGPQETETISLGQVGEHDPYVDIHNLGVGREIELEIYETDAVDFVLTQANITLEPVGA